MLKDLSSLVAPCVWAAALRTITRGWTCAASFGARAACRFGCGVGEDSLDHLPYCRVAADLYRRHFSVDLALGSDRVANFLLLKTPAPLLSAAASALYALYRAHNAARHGAASASDVFVQVAREGRDAV